MATWNGRIQQALLIHLGPGRRMLRLKVRFAVVDAGVIEPTTMTISYPTAPFAGLSLAQARDLVVEQGVGDIPPLLEIGANLLQDWERAEPLRSIPLNWEFGP